MTTHTPTIHSPPRNMAAWADLFDHRKLPVLAHTAEALDDLRAAEDSVDAHLLSSTIAQDPLMTLKLLAHVAHLRRGREGSEVETVTEALVMLGIPPFFRAFAELQCVEDLLAWQPEAMAGFSDVLRRSNRAARFAIGFAVHRMDHDAPVIHEAALLHDFAELLLWLRTPALASEITRRQDLDPQLRSAVAQQAVLNVELAEVQHHLMLAWRLPSLLVQITDDHAQRPTAQLRNVQLAIRLARHTARGWDNAAIPDDITDVANLLHLGLEPTARLLHDIDDES